MSELLCFRYEMRSEFDRPIERHSFRLMCLPSDGASQRVLDLRCDVDPCTWLSRGRDGFGNGYVYGLAAEPHDRFLARVEGCVEAHPREVEPRDEIDAARFLPATPLTAPGPLAAAYREAAAPPPGLDKLEIALYYMERLHGDIAYRSGVSDTLTPSEAVFERGQGVCQDFAHALITLCRMEGIPARYVAGMVLGEGETHAWVDAFAGGRWFALDPTRNCPADAGYIRLSHGRDCRDCLVNRGVYFNPAFEAQRISVNVSVKA